MKRIVAAVLASALSTTCLAAGLPTPNFGIGTQLNGVTLRPPGTSGATTSLNNGNNTTSGNNTHTGVESFTTPPIFSLTGILYGNGGSATTTIAPSAVLDLLSSTRGTVLYRGASGWAPLSGAAGTVVQFNGTGNDPTAAFPPAADPAAPRRVAVLNSGNGYTDTSSLTSSFAEYEMRCVQLIPSTAADILVRVQVGGSFVTSGYSSYSYQINSTGPGSSPSTTALDIAGPVSATRGINFTLKFSNPSSTSITVFDWTGGGWFSGGATPLYGSGMYATPGAITGLQVLAAGSATLTSGYCKIYGYN